MLSSTPLCRWERSDVASPLGVQGVDTGRRQRGAGALAGKGCVCGCFCSLANLDGITESLRVWLAFVLLSVGWSSCSACPCPPWLISPAWVSDLCCCVRRADVLRQCGCKGSHCRICLTHRHLCSKTTVSMLRVLSPAVIVSV